MEIFYQTIYIFLLAIILAFIEIQIEGPEGWVANLPVWRPKAGSRTERLARWLKIKKPLTGYHLGLLLFLFVLIHLPFVFGAVWSWSAEFKILAFYAFWLFIEDFLWFVLNPHFGLTKFKSEHIWWHDQWLIGAPVDYYTALIVSFLLYLPVKPSLAASAWEWLEILLTFVLLTVITAGVAGLFKLLTRKSS